MSTLTNPVDSLQKVASTVMNPSKVMSFASNKDVMQMVLLFVLLSPGLLVELPSTAEGSKLGVMNMKPNHTAVLVHALVLMVILMSTGVSRNKVMTAVLLFILLSPGFVVEVPSADGEHWYTNRTSYESIAVHALLFMVLYGALR